MSDIDGILGNRLLMRFRGIFDYNSALVYVVFGKSDGVAINLLETKDDSDTHGFAIDDHGYL